MKLKNNSPKNVKEKIILGMDPGTSIMGYGLILVKGNQLSLVHYGVIKLSSYANHELKLKRIFERVTAIINEYLPDEVAIEAPFYGKNVQSMLKLGRAQGVAIAAALNRGLPITEYAPKKVKQSVTGNGNASKEQVSGMISTLLNEEIEAEFYDATDALAVAICHFFGTQNQSSNTPRSTSWKAFLKDNPGRVK